MGKWVNGKWLGDDGIYTNSSTSSSNTSGGVEKGGKLVEDSSMDYVLFEDGTTGTRDAYDSRFDARLEEDTDTSDTNDTYNYNDTSSNYNYNYNNTNNSKKGGVVKGGKVVVDNYNSKVDTGTQQTPTTSPSGGQATVTMGADGHPIKVIGTSTVSMPTTVDPVLKFKDGKALPIEEMQFGQGGVPINTQSGQSQGSGNTKQQPTSAPIRDKNIIDTSEALFDSKKYNLSDEDLMVLAAIGYTEQRSTEGMKVAVSQIIRYAEANGYDPMTAITRGFYGSYKSGEYKTLMKDITPERLEAVRSIVNEGNNYLPENVWEHDQISDIDHISTGSKRDKDSYIPGKTIIYATSGSKYIFQGFAPGYNGDPYGQKVGEWFH